MFPVEIILADRKAFTQENDSLKMKPNREIAAHHALSERSNPQFLSPFEHSILFELGEDGFINKVVICIDLFNEVDVNQLEKQQGRGSDPIYFDKDAVKTWAIYVMGYVDAIIGVANARLPERKGITKEPRPTDSVLQPATKTHARDSKKTILAQSHRARRRAYQSFQ